MVSELLFPSNPTNGMLYEQSNGVFYQYDSTINAWLKITSQDIKLPLATSLSNGAMSATDLKKLNRLLFQPPTSTVIGNKCDRPYKTGVIELVSVDDFIKIEGRLNVRNIDSQGEVISSKVPYQIHQHTYGYDFNLDVQSLIFELDKRGQISLVGKVGDKGDKGDRGAAGISNIPAGRQGDVGDAGQTPSNDITLTAEVFAVEPRVGLRKALTGIRLESVDSSDTDYAMVFTRQTVGNPFATADKFNVTGADSNWVLAITAAIDDTRISKPADVCGIPGEAPFQYYDLYYLNLEPILDTIHDKYTSEVERLKKGYEDIVAFWLQTMSDLFDEQKRALCCALESCLSATKGSSVRQHMESVAAAAAGQANIVLHGRDSKEAIEIPSYRSLKEKAKRNPDVFCPQGGPSGEDPPVCEYPGEKCDDETVFPAKPTFPPSSAPVLPPSVSPPSIAPPSVRPPAAPPPSLPITPPSTPIVTPISSPNSDVIGVGVGLAKLSSFEATVDPLLNSTLSTAYSVPLPAGEYSVAIKHANAFINGSYRANIKIRFNSQTEFKTIGFLDKGSFSSASEYRQAYEGLTTSFTHAGGEISIYIPTIDLRECDGNIVLAISPIVDATPPSAAPKKATMAESELSAMEKLLANNQCLSAVVDLNGQDYILVKDHNKPFTLAWPTFDGLTFAPYVGDVAFEIDDELSNIIYGKLTAIGKGNLCDKLPYIMIPVII